ncbi:hypothetical protein D3C75_1284470 [compost metagenome]
MHHLIQRVVVHLSHHIVLAADALCDAGQELQLVVIAHLGTEDIVQRLDDFRQALLLRVMGLAAAHITARLEGVFAFFLVQA